jgi:KaiC/GvpD/RAD55 family RecA-like ATPase
MSLIPVEDNQPLNFDTSLHLQVFTQYKADLGKFIEVMETIDPEFKQQARRYYLNTLVDKWQQKLGYTIEDIKKDLYELMFPPIVTIEGFTVGEALAATDTGSSWIIPGLVPRVGLLLLGGLPKAGKSVLLYKMAYSVAVSGEFLGLPVKKGKVLFIQAEETEDLSKERLRLAGFGSLDIADHMQHPDAKESVYVKRNFNLKDDSSKLAHIIQAGGYSLVFIDSLRKVTHTSAESENSNEFGKMVYALQHVINQAGCACILIHHMNKGGNVTASSIPNNSIVGLFSGHTSITAAPDGLIALFPDEGPDGQRVTTLKTLPREGIAANITYRRNINEEGLWELECVNSNNLIGTNSLTLKILRVIHNADDGLSLTSLCEELGLAKNDDDLHKALNYLQSLRIVLSGVRVVETGRVRFYTLGKDSDWLLSSAVDSITAAIEDANALGQVRTRDDLRVLVNTWDRPRRIKAIQGMVRHEQDRINKLLAEGSFKIGDEVRYKDTCWVIAGVSEQTGLNSITYTLEGNEEPVLETALCKWDMADLFDD